MDSIAQGGGGDVGVNLEHLSINEIFFRVWRERLAVQPRAWTPRHLRLMRCAFVEMPTPYEPSEVPCAQEPTAETARSWGRKSAGTDWWFRTETMQEILASYSFTKIPGFLFFRFGRYDVELPCQTYVAAALGSVNNSQSRSISYVGYLDNVNRINSKGFPMLEQIGWTQEQPHVDPYIIAVLIAQAQRCQRRNAMRRPKESAVPADVFYRVHVILFNGRDKKQIWVYTARVTNAFLDKLAYPSRKPGPADLTSLHAWYIAVQIQPHESFHRRLMAAVHASPQGVKRRSEDD